MKIGKDKVYHFIAGFIIALMFGFFINPFWGLVFAGGAGALKEIVWDLKFKRGAFEVLDFFATLIGGVLGTIACLLIINHIIA